MYSISQINLGSHMFYNFSKNKIEWALYKHERTTEHFCNDFNKVVEICKQIQEEENKKSYGNAKPIYLFLNNEVVKSF